MKTITSKTAKNGAQLWYVDGKRTSRDKAMFIQRMNEREARRLDKCETEKAERENGMLQAVVSPAAFDAAVEGEIELANANITDEVTENNVETTDTASSMVIEVKTFDSGRFTVKLNGKKIALNVLEQAPYYDSADRDAVIIFNGRKFRNVGDNYNVFADENGYGFFVSGISGDIWNLGKGMTSIRDMSNEIAQIEAKRKASEEMWNAIKTDPLNALDTDDYAVTEDAFNFAVDKKKKAAIIIRKGGETHGHARKHPLGTSIHHDLQRSCLDKNNQRAQLERRRNRRC